MPSTENWKNINTFNYQHLGPFSFGWLGTSYRQKLVSVCKQTNVYRRFEGREQLKRILTDKMTVYLSCWLVTNQFVEDYYISFIVKVNKCCVEHLYICKVILKVSQTFIRLFTSYLSMHTKSRWLRLGFWFKHDVCWVRLVTLLHFVCISETSAAWTKWKWHRARWPGKRDSRDLVNRIKNPAASDGNGSKLSSKEGKKIACGSFWKAVSASFHIVLQTSYAQQVVKISTLHVM